MTVATFELLIGPPESEAGQALARELDEIDAEARADLKMPGFSLGEELERPFCRLTVAVTAEGRVSGFVIGWMVADELHVLHVVVRRSARRLGIGRTILEASFADATERGARIVLLEVRRSNVAAIRLYRGVGFIAIGLRAEYYNDGEDAVLMARGLVEGAIEAFGDPMPLD